MISDVFISTCINFNILQHFMVSNNQFFITYIGVLIFPKRYIKFSFSIYPI